MTHIDVSANMNSTGFGARWAPARQPAADRSARAPESVQTRALVHVIDVDNDERLRLTRWLPAGIELQTHVSLEEFRHAHRVELPGCLVIDAQRLATLPLAMPCPVVVTAYQAGVPMVVRAMRAGAIDFVEKPLREQEIIAAIHSAIEADREGRRIAARHVEMRARFATLTRRERQVMARVTAGKLNKQVGADLGLSEITVKAHRGSMVRKMGARSLADLVRMALVLGEELAA